MASSLLLLILLDPLSKDGGGPSTGQKIANEIAYNHLDSFYQTKYKPKIHGFMPKLENAERSLKEFVQGIGVETWVE